MSGNADIFLGTLSPFWHKRGHFEHVYIRFSCKPRLVFRVCKIQEELNQLGIHRAHRMVEILKSGIFQSGELASCCLSWRKQATLFPPAPPKKSYFWELCHLNFPFFWAMWHRGLFINKMLCFRASSPAFLFTADCYQSIVLLLRNENLPGEHIQILTSQGH